ncbi:MAG TPA: hypothetical protein PKY82_28795 [Pyrinomonadaceae bacterium]|nr:hypothetical protein [Pyrinomonadaceae bacterium]
MEINQIKEHLRFIEDETESVKRSVEELKRISPIEESKILPIGITLLLLGFIFACVAFWSISHQFGGFLLLVNGILAFGSIYFGTKIIRFGFKFKQIIRKNDHILQKAEKLKEELEQQLAEKQ